MMSSEDQPETPAMGSVNGVFPRCPICGNNFWGRKAPHGLKPGEQVKDLVMADKGGGSLIAMVVINFICMTCGFVRQHDPEIYKP